MSNNVKQQGKFNGSAAVFQQGQRNLKKRDYKQALKDARVCYRQSAIDEHRILLEQASIGRARELDQAGLKPQAHDILQELLVQPVIDSAVRQELPELLSRLAMLDRYPEYRQRLDADPELKAKLVVRAADSAVLHLSDAKNAAPEIRHGAALVLAALDQLDAGMESESLELLKDISRQSPFADWRLFVRGLAAYHRHDQVNTDANWSRLDSDRVPARLARLLKAIRESDTEAPSDPNLANALAALEAALWGAPLLTDFRFLKERAAAGEWLKVVSVLRNMRERLRVVDPVASEAITSFLVGQAISTTDRELLRELMIHAEPLPWDPNWNHAKARLFELAEDQSLKEFVGAWTKYLGDLEHVRCWTEADITLAKALVLEKLGVIYSSLTEDAQLDAADRARKKIPNPDPLTDAECEALDWDYDFELIPSSFFERKAQQALEASLALRPDLRETHGWLCSLWELTKAPLKAVQARINLLAQFPDDLVSLERLAHYHNTRGEFSEALKYLSRMRQLKPLDEVYRRRCWNVHMNLFREHLKGKKLELAIEQLKAAESLNANDGQKYLWLTRSAIVQREQGNTERYEALLTEAEQVAGHPAAVWFAMTADAALISSPLKLYQIFEKRFLDALKTSFHAAAAGWMAEFANALLGENQKYTGQVKHFRALSDYLKLGKKSKFDYLPLREICDFLFAQKDKGNKTILEHYLKHGRGRFRDAGFFSACLGLLNLQLGPKKCDYDYIQQMLEDAQAKLLNSDDPADKALLPNIQHTLAFLDDLDDMDDDLEYGDVFGGMFTEDLFVDISQEEFSRMMRQELDRQISRATKSTKTLASLSAQEFKKIVTPRLMMDLCKNLGDKLGLDPATISEMVGKTSIFDIPIS